MWEWPPHGTPRAGHVHQGTQSMVPAGPTATSLWLWVSAVLAWHRWAEAFLQGQSGALGARTPGRSSQKSAFTGIKTVSVWDAATMVRGNTRWFTVRLTAISHSLGGERIRLARLVVSTSLALANLLF